MLNCRGSRLASSQLFSGTNFQSQITACARPFAVQNCIPRDGWHSLPPTAKCAQPAGHAASPEKRLLGPRSPTQGTHRTLPARRPGSPFCACTCGVSLFDPLKHPETRWVVKEKRIQSQLVFPDWPPDSQGLLQWGRIPPAGRMAIFAQRPLWHWEGGASPDQSTPPDQERPCGVCLPLPLNLSFSPASHTGTLPITPSGLQPHLHPLDAPASYFPIL